MMRADQYMRKVFDFEREQRTDEWEIKGFKYWQRLRVFLVCQLETKYKGLGIEPKYAQRVNTTDDAAKRATFFEKFWSKNPFLARRCDIVFWGHPRRKRNAANGLWEDIYCDPIMGGLSKDFRVLALEPPFRHFHFYPAANPNLFFADAVTTLQGILKRVTLPIRLAEDTQHQCELVDNWFFEHFAIKIEAASFLRADLKKRQVQLIAFTLLLRILRPKLVLIVVAFAFDALVEACKRLNIPTAEIQHGGLDEFHDGYSFPVAKKPDFPDYFLSFGSYWSRICPFPIPKDHIYDVGFKYLEDDAAKMKEIRDEKSILFLSMGFHITKHMAGFIGDVAEQIPDYKIYFKLHPAEGYDDIKAHFPSLDKKNVEILSGQETPLNTYLKRCAIHVSVNSTAIFEGSYLGSSAFILTLPGIEHMDDFLKTGLGTVVSTPREFVEKISTHKPRSATEDEKNMLFTFGAEENIRNAVADIIRKNKSR